MRFAESMRKIAYKKGQYCANLRYWIGSVMAKRIEINASAPDFKLPDFNGRPVRLSDYHDRRHVVLVFNRGFF